MISYKVENTFFSNIYLALHHSFKTNHKVEFICKDSEYDSLDWTKEPEESLEQLMLKHALDLRHRYERIILGWSGGTDSHTIYKIFKKYKIHIDEILIKTSTRIAHQPKKNVDWIKKNHYDSSTIITEYDQYDDFLKNLECPNDEWIWNNKGNLLIFGVTTGGDTSQYLIEKNHSGKKYIYIAGYEKPYLIYKNKKWYARHLDKTLRGTMGYDYIDHFYLSPLINLKQNHLLKRATKELITKNNLKLEDNDTAEEKWGCNDNNFGYQSYASASGRTEELNNGISFLQKIEYNKQFLLNLNVKKKYNNKLFKDKVLSDFLSNENKTAINYINGIYNLYSESKFIYKLHENKIINSRELICLPNIWSKTYNLGP